MLRLAELLCYEEDMHFEGIKKAEEIAVYYAFANCFVLPSVREPWGLVVNEAMAAGLPVIVSHRCGCAEDLVIHNRNGYVFDPEDVDHLRAVMLSFDRHPDKTALMGMQSRLRDVIRHADGLHIHGLWEEHCAVAASMAHVLDTPYLISAHGMLEDWAFRDKGLKKRVYSALVEVKNLRRAVCLRALTTA